MHSPIPQLDRAEQRADAKPVRVRVSCLGCKCRAAHVDFELELRCSFVSAPPLDYGGRARRCWCRSGSQLVLRGTTRLLRMFGKLVLPDIRRPGARTAAMCAARNDRPASSASTPGGADHHYGELSREPSSLPGRSARARPNPGPSRADPLRRDCEREWVRVTAGGAYLLAEAIGIAHQLRRCGLSVAMVVAAREVSS